MSDKSQQLDVFLVDLESIGDQSSLVFTATPGTANALMKNLIEADVSYPTDLGKELQEWIKNNYHKDWPVAEGSGRGIAIHHGRLPRSLGQLFVQLFDKGIIKLLICTSTLIEGVNTAAANVFIYDKKINRTDFDFFSFANIRGRVGRMMRHFVGNVFLYHEAPLEVETRVAVPVLADPGSSTDFLVMNVNRDELSTSGRERYDRLPKETGLPEELLKEHGALGTPLLVELLARVQKGLNDEPERYIWSGFPVSGQRIAAAELALMISHARQERTGLHTARQVAWAWSQLAKIRTLPKFLRWYAGTFGREDHATGVDSAFQFLQACEFSFTRGLAAIESVVKYLEPSASVAYGPYIVGLENWFRPSWMKQLDEAGVPIPLAERIQPYLKSPASRTDAINQIRQLDNNTPGLDNIDRFILQLLRGEDSTELSQASRA